ncbi:MAG: hypothetical protein ABIL22_04620 [candidate division WOR-3 bacterium]
MKVRLKIILIVILITACGPKFVYYPVPEKDIKKWVSNFEQQKSFSYRYELKTKTVTVRAYGDCIYGWAEHTKGLMDYGDTIVSFEYIGINDREWTKKDNKWEESVRGEESNFLAQIERVLDFEKFEFLNADSDYLYQFNATMPFLAPERWREMVAWIKISRHQYLPSFIWVGLPDSSIYWQVSLANYNKSIKIEPPYVDIKKYEIKIDSTVTQTEAIEKIKRRLKLLNLMWQLKKEDEKIILQVPGIYNVDDIRELLAPGRTVLYGVAQKQIDAVRISYLKRNPNTSVYLNDWQCNQDLIMDVTIRLDHLSKPFMLIKLKKKIEFPEQVAIEVDSNIVAFFSLDKVKRMDKIIVYSDMPYLDFWKLRACMCQPLFRVDISPVSKGSD